MTDGVIKFRIDHTSGPALEESFWRPIEPIRRRLYKLGLIGVRDGIGYGNVSRRLEEGRIVVTATQTGHLPRLDGEGYALVEAYDEAAFRIRSRGAAKPSSETLTHAALYEIDPLIGWVIHIHSAPLWEMMMRSKKYLKSADVPYGTPEMVREVRRIYEGRDPLKEPLFAMAGHEEGIVAFGRSGEEALQTIESLLSTTSNPSRY
ncbi:class II aldolase/adducin family protein [Hydrogenimonas sp.]